MRNRKRITATAIILSVVILLVLSVTYNLKYNPELNGFYRILFGNRTVSGTVVPLDGGVRYRAVRYMDTVALTGGGQMMFVKKNGSLSGDHPLLSMSAPMLSASGKYLIVGDTEGTGVVIFANKKKIRSLQTEGKIYSVRINSNGYYLIISEEKGYKGLVTLYSNLGTEIYRWHSGDRNILDADIDYDGTSFKVALLDTDSGQAAGRILFFRTDAPEPVNEISSNSNLFCRLTCNRDHSLTALGDTALTKFSPNGQELWSVDYSDQTLLSADISSVDRLVVLRTAGEAADGRGGSALCVYNRNGKEKNVITFDGQGESMSVCDDIALILRNPKILVSDIDGSGVVDYSSGKDLKFVTVFQDKKHALAVSSGGYEILKIR